MPTAQIQILEPKAQQDELLVFVFFRIVKSTLFSTMPFRPSATPIQSKFNHSAFLIIKYSPTCSRLKSGLPTSRSLLPILLMSLKIKIPKFTHSVSASISCTAAITCQAIGDNEEQNHIEQCSTKENAKRPKQVSVAPSNAARGEPNNNNRNAKSLWKVFSYKQLRARTDQTPNKSRVSILFSNLNRPLGDSNTLATGWTCKRRGIFNRRLIHARVTGRTRTHNIHAVLLLHIFC